MRAFLSSTYRDPAVPASERHLSIWRRHHEFALDRRDLSLWIAEYSDPALADRSWFEILDACVRELRAADVFVAVLFKRAGKAILWIAWTSSWPRS